MQIKFVYGTKGDYVDTVLKAKRVRLEDSEYAGPADGLQYWESRNSEIYMKYQKTEFKLIVMSALAFGLHVEIQL